MNNSEVFVKTRFWREGPFLKSCTTMCVEGNPEVLCFQVDLRPIEAAVRRYHAKMHGGSVSGCVGDNLLIGAALSPYTIAAGWYRPQTDTIALFKQMKKRAPNEAELKRLKYVVAYAMKGLNNKNETHYENGFGMLEYFLQKGHLPEQKLVNPGGAINEAARARVQAHIRHYHATHKSPFEQALDVVTAPLQAIGTVTEKIGRSKIVKAIADGTTTIIKTAGQIAAPIASFIPIPGVALLANVAKNIDDPKAIAQMVTTPGGLLNTAAGIIPIPGVAVAARIASQVAPALDNPANLLKMVTSPQGLLKTAAGIVPIPGGTIAAKMVANFSPAIQAGDKALSALAVAHTALGALEKGATAKRVVANFANAKTLVSSTKVAVSRVGPAAAKETLAAHPAIAQKVTKSLLVLKQAPKLAPVISKAEADSKLAWTKIAQWVKDSKSTNPEVANTAKKNLQILSVTAKARNNIKAIAENKAGGVPGVLIDAKGRQIKGRFVVDAKAPEAILYTSGTIKRGKYRAA